MATEYSILARLTANTKQYIRDITGAFRTTEAAGGKAAESIGRRFAKATGAAAGKLAKRGAQGLAGIVGLGVKEAIDFEKVIDDIGIQSGATATEMDAFRKAAVGVSDDTGIAREDVAKAGEALVNLLGPAGRNEALLGVLGRTAVASGAEIGDLAGLVSATADSFGIAVDDTEGMEAALSAFLATGKQGKVPLSEMNIVLQEVASNFAEMGAKGPKAAADVSAALQIARRSFGSAGQAGTGLKAGTSALKKHADKIDKEIRRLSYKDKSMRKLRGFTVWADKSKTALKDFRELAPVLSRMNLDQLQATMGSAEAAKFWAAFKGEGWDNFVSMADVAREATDVTDDFAKRQGTESFRLQRAWNKARLALAKAITPELVERFVSGVETLADVFQFLSKNVTAVVAALASLKALQMATDFSKTARAAGNAADAVKGVGASAAGAAGPMSMLQKVSGGMSALLGGFAVGQAVGGAIVGDRATKFEAEKKRQQKNVRSMEESSAAVQDLLEAGLVSEQGQLSSEFAKDLARARLRGEKLSPLQEQAKAALAGYESPQAASVGVAEQFGFTAPERDDRVLIQSNILGPLIGELKALGEELQNQRAATVENTKAQRPTGKRSGGGMGDMGKR
jgi:hypothetical protein